jgi:hypothetical protein
MQRLQGIAKFTRELVPVVHEITGNVGLILLILLGFGLFLVGLGVVGRSLYLAHATPEPVYVMKALTPPDCPKLDLSRD